MFDKDWSLRSADLDGFAQQCENIEEAITPTILL